jgi:septum formation protein
MLGTLPKIILGSSSRSRRGILVRLGLSHEVMRPDIDEKAIRDADPCELTLKLGHAKAEAIIARLAEPALVITSDQVTMYEGEIREKPVDEAEARRCLGDYERAPVQTVTSLVITDTATGRQFAATDTVTVRFRPIPEDLKRMALERGDILQYAGAFAVDDPDLAPCVASVNGEGTHQENLDSVVGLPTRLLREFLYELGVPLPGQQQAEALRLMAEFGVRPAESILLKGSRPEVEQHRQADNPERRQYGTVPFHGRREEIVSDFPAELAYFSHFRPAGDGTETLAKYAESLPLFAMKFGRPMREFAQEIMAHYPDLGRLGRDISLFGLSGSGKSALMTAVRERLGSDVVVMDSDTVRYNLFGKMVRDVETAAGADLDEVRHHLIYNDVSNCLYLLRHHVAAELKGRGYTVIQNATTPRFGSDRLIYVENPDGLDPLALADADIPKVARSLSEATEHRGAERDNYDWDRAETVTDFHAMRPVSVRVDPKVNEQIIREVRQALMDPRHHVEHLPNRRTADGRGLAEATERLMEMLGE